MTNYCCKSFPDITKFYWDIFAEWIKYYSDIFVDGVDITEIQLRK